VWALKQTCLNLGASDVELQLGRAGWRGLLLVAINLHLLLRPPHVVGKSQVLGQALSQQQTEVNEPKTKTQKTKHQQVKAVTAAVCKKTRRTPGMDQA
jgi:hypothetical protein